MDDDIEVPTLRETIKDILEEYPSGQIFKEIIQNADDARATEVKFFLDYRHIQTVTPSLINSPDLHLFEGPALLAYNNAGFEEKDWKNIRKLKSSEKAQDCMKVGKFGRGFNSVYHITDLPVILSGEKYSIMDPFKMVCSNGSVKTWYLSEVSGKINALNGICGFRSECHNFHGKTLFRFPLRKNSSDPFFKCYKPEELQKLIQALKEEAKYLLIFLRSVQSIEIHEISDLNVQKIIFNVSITEKRQRELVEFETKVKREVQEKPWGEVVSLTSQFTVIVAEQGMADLKYEWLVVQQVGSTSKDVQDKAKEFEDRGVSVLPWVGTAVELSEPSHEFKGSRIFCFLPMPFQQLSPLPVHVNGTFAVSKNRQSLKWPGLECQNDLGAQWNEVLTNFCLPSCYKQLLVSLTKRKSVLPSTVYKAWPDPNVVCMSEWNGLLDPLFSSLLHEHVLYSPARGGQWVTLDQALLTPENSFISKVVLSCLLKCDLKLVNTNSSLIWEVINFCTDRINLALSYTCISPDFVAKALKCNPLCYKELEPNQKLELLLYCMSDVSEYSHLEGLELLPLANHNGDIDFARFQQRTKDNEVYVCTSSIEFPTFFLPSFGRKKMARRNLVKENDCLQSHFENLADSGYTQVCKLTLEVVATLLPQSIKTGWSDGEYKSFWNWVQPHNLSYFVECPVIPIASGNPVNLSAKTVLITESNKDRLTLNLPDALKRIGIKLARQDKFPFLKHENILDHVDRFTPEVVLNIASFSEQIVFKPQESEALQAFLATSDITSPRSIEALRKMRIFHTLQHGNSRVFSINEVDLVEDSNCLVKISQSCLPPLPLVFSRKLNNTVLLQNIPSLTHITMYDYICDHAFPLIRDGSFPSDKLKGFMVEVLLLVLALHESDADRQNIIEKMKQVPFLRNCTNELKCPTELFDSNCETAVSLYKGEPVFPVAPFNAKKYSPLLRSAGLRSKDDIRAFDVYMIVDAIKCTSPSTCSGHTNYAKYARACAVIKFISSNSNLLDEQYTFIFRRTLYNDLVSLDHTVSWLPVCFTPPPGYPTCLSWKGSAYRNCLVSRQEGILPFIPKLALIAGSQLLFIQDAVENKLTSALMPSYHEIAKAIVIHFIKVTEKHTKINPEERDNIVNWTYTFLNSVISSDDVHWENICELIKERKWIWLDEKGDFVEADAVAIEKNPSFSENLEPFIYTLPLKYAKFKELFKMFGVLEQISAEQIVSVLMLIKRKGIDSRHLEQLVRSILEWVADNQNHSFDRSKVLVPVKGEGDYPVLKFVDEVAYADSKFLMLAATKQRKVCPIVLPSFVGIARKLGVKSLSKHLGIVEDELPQDVGQQEPLITRLKNILEDYKDGLTIIKELLQNADDAVATELNIVYDSRNHCSDADYLLFPGMAKAHGPALLVHNDQTFTDDDFENITKLAGATKRDKPLKIGKFGVGFCSVYHITDVPSFVSREWLYIFDPTLKHLENEVDDPAQPGQKIRCTCPLLRDSRQFDPYQSIFKYDSGSPYKGTIFRLPFRIKQNDLGKCYGSRDVDCLKKQLLNEGSKLLLFLHNVKKLTFSEFKHGYGQPKQLIVIQKVEEICVSPASAVNHIVLKTENTENSTVTLEDWIVSNYSENTDHTDYQSASVACKLESTHLNQYYRVAKVDGEIFCSLPLDLESGLHVHISANFAVSTDRKDIIKSKTHDQLDEEAKWNRELMEKIIPKAYIELLLALREIATNKCLSLKLSDYSFHSLWPLEKQLKNKNPWSKFITELYKLLLGKDLFYSQSRDQWMNIDQSRFTSGDVFSSLSPICRPPECVVKALEILQQPIVELPTGFHNEQLLFDNMNFIKENEFIEMFITQISLFSSDLDTRNKTILLILELYAWTIERNMHFSNHDQLTLTACIPCTPHGDGELKYCKDLVDSSVPIAGLFEASDSLFPITMLSNSQPAMRAMRALGLQTESVSYELLANCAQRIKELHSRNETKAYEKMLLIFKCIKKNHQDKVQGCRLLEKIPFLPVMPAPEKYILPWHGRQNQLLPPCQLYSGAKLPPLVGSQLAILNIPVFKSQPSYSKMPSYVLSDIGVSLKPPISTVINQLLCLIDDKRRQEAASADAIGSMYSAICSYLDDYLEEQQDLYEIVDLQSKSCVWTGRQFVKPKFVAKKWKSNGPILYPVPEALKSSPSLYQALECKDFFSTIDLLEVLSLLHEQYGDKPLPNECQSLVREILPELDNFPVENFTDYSDRDNVMIPDTSFILHRVSDLVFNDVELHHIKHNFKIANSCISPSLAKKLGITFIRQKTLQHYERKHHGREFGQCEDLPNRIATILEQYPFDVTFIKEILQNADDARASKLCIILDTRKLVAENSQMISDNWKELQGPALLFWNNTTFTEKDLQGIQDLGMGGKRGDSETIGQFGIGFNVAYHVTDCPSFITCVKGERLLCVFDPFLRYVPEADISRPGRQFEANDDFWEDFSAIKPGYCIDVVNGCPEDMKNDLWKGTLFRFPIRETNDEVSSFNRVFTELTPSKLSTERLMHHIEQWIRNIKLSLLFLRHLTDIRFYLINEQENMKLLANFSVDLTSDVVESRASIETCASSFNSQQGCTSQVFMYPLTITSSIRYLEHDPETKLPMINRETKSFIFSTKSESKETWLVQAGVGDIDCQEQNWSFVPKFKPRHGLAAPLQQKQSITGNLFCFLPLPLSSHMPVHINGQFMLASNRRELWKSTNSNDPDDRSKWNDRLLQAIASSYAQFLLNCRTHYVKESYSDRKSAIADIESYYKIYPTKRISLELMKNVAEQVIIKLGQQNSLVLCSVKQQTSGYVAEWSPLKEEEDKLENQSYMLFVPQKNKEETSEEFDKRKKLHSNLRCLLESIGMNINSVPRFIWKAFKNLAKCEIPIAEGEQVFLFCKQFPHKIGNLPCPIEQSSIGTVENFTALMKCMCFCNFINGYLQFPNDCIGAPFLLTADQCLHAFDKQNGIILSKHYYLFTPNCGRLFAHPSLVEMNVDPAYFYQPDEKNFDFVAEILKETIPLSLLTATVDSYQDKLSKEFLSNLWKCVTDDPVVSCHFTSIISMWALIPSQQNQLFRYSEDTLLPVYAPSYADDTQETLFVSTLNILKKLQMPFLDTEICSSERLLSFCPSITNPETILENLTHLHKLHPIQLDVPAIRTLFEYFSAVSFGSSQNTTNRNNIRSLPFFQNIDGTLTSINGKKVFVWPDSIEEAGLSQWFSQCDIVILTRDGEWNKLGVSDTIFGICKVTGVQLYMEYIFPQFSLLSESDRYKHLEYIRDNLSIEIKSQEAFERFKCIENERGELECISNIHDPKVKLFCTFHSDFIFPHEKYCDDEWLEFFRENGLQQEVTIPKFEELCRRIEKGDHPELQQASAVLLEHLLYVLCKMRQRLVNNPMAVDWRNDKEFLRRIFDISFVVAEDLPQLNWIAPQCVREYCVNDASGTTHYLTKLNAAAISDVADTVWTVRPIIRLPCNYSCAAIGLYHIDVKFLLAEMGLIMNPSVSDILKNIHNIATNSEFTNLNLFDQYTSKIDENQNLSHVMSHIFQRLSNSKTELQKFQSDLQSAKFIPVFAGNLAQENWFILVEPRCVIANTSVNEFQPYLNPLPNDLFQFMPVLEGFGVKQSLEFEHCCYALEKMSHHEQLDVNTLTVLEKLLKHMSSILQDQSSTVNATTLYLPNTGLRMVPSKCLVYCDEKRYENCKYTIIENSSISVLWLPDSFKTKAFCKLLPEIIRPNPLSSCKEQLLTLPNTETSTNPVTEELQKALQLEKIVSVFKKILHHRNVEEEKSKKALEYFTRVLFGAKVVALPDLTVTLSYSSNESEAIEEIAKCRVDYFIDESQHKRTTIFIDSTITDLSTALLKVQMPLASQMLTFASLDSYEDLHYIISLLLKTQNMESLKAFYNRMCDDPESDPDPIALLVSPKVGLPVPECWHHILDQNVRNIFRPGEWVALETEPGSYIFTKIAYPDVNQSGRMPDDIYSHQYFILDPDEESRSVSILLLYKFKRSARTHQPASQAVHLHDNNDHQEERQHQFTPRAQRCKDEILELIAGLDNYEHNKQQRIIRRLYLQWHPDKNLDNTELAHNVFTFLVKELEKRKIKSSSFDEWESEAGSHRQAATDPQRSPPDEYFQGQTESLPDIHQANRWLSQARLDKQALDILFLSGNARLSGHVCFLAHEGVEKALKAGMYIVQGSVQGYLTNHRLYALFSNIAHKLTEKSCHQVRSAVCELEEYYNNTRWPNRWFSDKGIPADHYTPHDAQSASDRLTFVIETIEKLVQSVSDR